MKRFAQVGLALLTVCCLYAMAAQAQATPDLNGIWLDGGRLIRIKKAGNSVHAAFIAPKICDHADDTERTSEYPYSFEGKLTGNQLEGTTCVCNYGKDNKRGVGIEKVGIKLMAVDRDTLMGTYHNTRDDVWVPISFTRVDCKKKLEELKAEMDKWARLREEILEVMEATRQHQSEAVNEGLDAWETGMKRQLIDLSPIPLGLDTKEAPAEEAGGWIVDTLEWFEKKLPTPVAKGIKKFAWVKYFKDAGEMLAKQVTKLQETTRMDPAIDRIADNYEDAYQNFIKAAAEYFALKEHCKDEVPAGAPEAAAPSPAQAAAAYAQSQARRAEGTAQFRSAGEHLKRAIASLKPAETAMSAGSKDARPTDAEVELLRRSMIAMLKSLREGVRAQRKGLAAWTPAKPVG